MNDDMPVDDLLLACSFWLKTNIETLIPAMNDRVAGLFAPAVPILVNTSVLIGELTNAVVPTICTWAESGSQPIPLDLHGNTPECLVAVMYKIRIALPEVGGGDTATFFELTKQVVLGKLFGFFWDKSKTLQPTVYTKSDPDIQVTASGPCMPGDWRSTHLRPLADKNTIARGGDITFTFRFQICNTVVLSAPTE